MSAVGTTLLQSPGCNEGKARNETLSTHVQKQNEFRRSGTNSQSICFVLYRCGSLGKYRPVGTLFRFAFSSL